MRRLSELQLVSQLRREGWEIPPSVEDKDLLRVYDTRLDHQWLRRLHGQLQLRVPIENTYLIGGDFLHRSAVTDGDALNPSRLQRWGPSSAVDPYHVFVVPRPHHTEWVQRAHRQVSIEGTGAWVSVA